MNPVSGLFLHRPSQSSRVAGPARRDRPVRVRSAKSRGDAITPQNARKAMKSVSIRIVSGPGCFFSEFYSCAGNLPNDLGARARGASHEVGLCILSVFTERVLPRRASAIPMPRTASNVGSTPAALRRWVPGGRSRMFPTLARHDWPKSQTSDFVRRDGPRISSRAASRGPRVMICGPLFSLRLRNRQRGRPRCIFTVLYAGLSRRSCAVGPPLRTGARIWRWR
jgi:hypothetical protein